MVTYGMTLPINLVIPDQYKLHHVLNLWEHFVKVYVLYTPEIVVDEWEWACTIKRPLPGSNLGCSANPALNDHTYIPLELISVNIGLLFFQITLHSLNVDK